MPLKLHLSTMQQKCQENISRNLIASRVAFEAGRTKCCDEKDQEIPAEQRIFCGFKREGDFIIFYDGNCCRVYGTNSEKSNIAPIPQAIAGYFRYFLNKVFR